ncbi:2-oxo-4-hydroxy-4-carboxy-5-ureidoimidazoline decarboxylase [Pararobbsia silviterrae]|uniref:2-oxo-4-hydroxy-4-carboxy-5-ureidoimidazoline decarboxylase n=1 Tax=Pararobbsia silviterrae TaxID=1792498 RepID=A0A494XVQ3_9BURK|nr:2-oxo-4-hydroxy-4-carboxy-5-ureidoimidazoline decarboxylase [Pararobbsia silviterrae]RKP54701.1 2-oxo-4-hydroxy-4-carboxy-5-ureidoimidazoline decarboxylase [Pararobbsia silviterrae]
MMITTWQIDALGASSRDTFVGALGSIFEHSAWVAERAWDKRPFATLDALHQTMCGIVDAADPALQLALINAHPELAGKAAIRGELTAESTREQSGAGLDQCTPEEFAELQALNHAYRERFGFPFILAVKGYDRAGILAQMRRRIDHDRPTELRESLAQIYRIARFRLEALISEH